MQLNKPSKQQNLFNIIKNGSTSEGICDYAVYKTEALSRHDTYSFTYLPAANARLVFFRDECTQCKECETECQTGVFRKMDGMYDLVGELCVWCCECLTFCPTGAIVEAEIFTVNDE